MHHIYYNYQNAVDDMVLACHAANIDNPFPRIDRLELSCSSDSAVHVSTALLNLTSPRRLLLNFPTIEVREADQIKFFNFAISRSSTVEELALHMPPDDAITTPGWLHSLTHLHTFTFETESLTQSFLETVSTLPKLRELRYMNPSSDALPPDEASRVGFPQLLKFGCYSYPIYTIRSYINTLPRNQIEELDLTLAFDIEEDEVQAGSLIPLCKEIVELGQKSLKVIHITFEITEEYPIQNLEPLTECSELMDLKLAVSEGSTLGINDSQLETLAQSLKKLEFIYIGPDSGGGKFNNNLSLLSLDSFSMHCPAIQYIGLFLMNLQLPSPHRHYTRFTNDMTFEFFESRLDYDDVFPISLHLSAMCRPPSRRPPAVVGSKTYDWVGVSDTVRKLHTVLEAERRWARGVGP